MIADLSATRIDAHIAEAHLPRIEIGSATTFVPADIAQPRLEASVVGIDGAAMDTLPDAELASVQGGPIASWLERARGWCPRSRSTA